jgi:hypothetical protein
MSAREPRQRIMDHRSPRRRVSSRTPGCSRLVRMAVGVPCGRIAFGGSDHVASLIALTKSKCEEPMKGVGSASGGCRIVNLLMSSWCSFVLVSRHQSSPSRCILGLVYHFLSTHMLNLPILSTHSFMLKLTLPVRYR